MAKNKNEFPDQKEEIPYYGEGYISEKDIIGEITIVVKGIKKRDLKFNSSELRKDLRDLVEAGLSLSAASKYLAKKNGLKKSEIYKMV